MKKLALVVPSLAQGGGVPAVARFIKDAALRSGRYELKLISLCMASSESSHRSLSKPATWLRGPVTTTGVWEGLPFTHVGANWGEFEFQRYQPRRILTDLLSDCDLVQVVCGSPAWANTVTGLGKPVALQVATRIVVERRQRNSQAHGLKGWWRICMTAIANRLDDRGLHAVDAIQVENPWMLDYARHINAGRAVDMRYAPPGINTELFRPLDQRDVDRDPYILCVGRLSDPRKNIHLLLEAYSLLPAQVRATVRLVLAGSSGPSEAFWKHTNKLGLRDRITFIASPERDELVHLYQEASVFALPSDEEGFGVVVLEAMACSVPVVSTRSGGPDGIITDGEDGFLVPLNDASAMANCMQLLLENSSLNIAMGRKAHTRAESRYDERITGAVFVDVWDRLLK